jgi:uncharacterized protein RhaS with RHS repeats
MTAFFNSPDGQTPQGVFVLNPATGQPSAAPTPGLTDTQLRATAVPVAGPLTNTQLRATPVPVSVPARTCLGTARLTIPVTSVTLAGATGGIAIPAGAVTAEIQADGGAVRMRRDGSTPTATLGYRLEDGLEKVVDSTLADVRLIAQGGACFVNVAYFNQV